MPQIAWVGLGSIGEVVCCNLAQHADMQGPLLVWNRTSAKAERLAATSDKIVAAESLTVAISRADIVCLCLSDDKAVADVIDVAAHENVTGKLFVDMSTVHPDTSDAQSLRLMGCGATYLACPIFGGVALAINRQITLVLAGPADGIGRFAPFTDGIICKDSIKLPHQPCRQATVLKLVGNFVRFSSIEILCEASVLSEKLGLPREILSQFVQGMIPGPAAGQLAMLNSGAYYDAESKIAPISMAVKENTYLNDLAEQHKVKLRSLDTVTALANRVAETRGPDANLLGIFGAIREESGLPFENKESI